MFSELCFKILVIIVLSCICYHNSFENELAFDDLFAILYNRDTSPLGTEYISIWKHDFWGNDISLTDSHKSYRPITITYFRLIRHYTLSLYHQDPDRFFINNATTKEQNINPEYIHREKDLQPFYFHFGNLFIHTLNSILIMILVRFILFNHYQNENKYKEFGFISGLLFCSHPIHVEAVTGIVGGAELLSCFFGLLSFIFYTFIHQKESSLFIHMIYTLFTSIFYYFSALSKEGGVTISALMILYSIFVLWKDKIFNIHQNSVIKQVIFSCFLAIILLISYLKLRWYLTGTIMSVGNEVFRKAENPVAFADLHTKLLTIPYMHYYYYSLLIYPHPLSADYSFNCIPLITEINDYRNAFSVIIYSVIFISMIVCLINIFIKTMKYWDLIILFAWSIVPFIPASNIFFHVGTFIAERLLYLPSIGFCILIAYLLINFTFENKLFLWSIVGIILYLYGYKTYIRNFDWKNEETLFESAYFVCPDSVKVLQNSAILDRRYLRFEESLNKLYKAKEIEPSFCSVDHWIGITLINKGDVINGIKILKESLDCKFALKDTAQSLQKLFQILLTSYPNNPVFIYEWGFILYKLKQKTNHGGAYQYLQQALNQFILNLINDINDINDINNTEKQNIDTFDYAEKMEDILFKLSEQNSFYPIDCFHRLATIIIDYIRIIYYFEKKKYKDYYYYSIKDMISDPQKIKTLKKKNKKNKTKILQRKKSKLKKMDFDQRKIFYKKHLLQSLKHLAEISWKSINENDCKQEYETIEYKYQSSINNWQKTWNYFTLNIVESVVTKQQNLGKRTIKYYNKTDIAFWNELTKNVQLLSKKWEKYKESLDYSQLSQVQKNILQNGASDKNKNIEMDRIGIHDCSSIMQKGYDFLQNKLKDKSRDNHFLELVNLKPQIDETMDTLKSLIKSNDCDIKTKIFCLDGLAIILTPYIKSDKNEWYFDGLLENEALIAKIQNNGKAMYIQPTIQMIGNLYPYIQHKMKELGVKS